MKTILVVDDDPSIRALIRLYLEGAGYAVVEAVDGRRGVQLLGNMGIPADTVIVFTFILGSAFAGLAGIFFAMMSLSVLSISPASV